MEQREVSMEQWALGVALSKKYVETKPWEQFEDMEIFSLVFNGGKECVYASIMGYHKMCYGLSFYQGEEGFKDLSSVAFEIDNEPFQNYIMMQSSFYSVYFDDQANVSFEQAQAYRNLGLRQEAFPHFTRKEKSCFPDDPNAEEMDHFITYMAGLLDAIEYFLKHEVIIDFTTSLFCYDVEERRGYVEALTLEPRVFEPIVPSNEAYLHQLRKQECNNEVWEIEYNFINQGMQREDGRIENVRLIMCACIDDQSMIGCTPFADGEDENEAILVNFFKWIEQYGKPLNLQICNVRLLPILGLACERLGIALEMGEQFEVIDDFLQGLYEFSANEEHERS